MRQVVQHYPGNLSIQFLHFLMAVILALHLFHSIATMLSLDYQHTVGNLSVQVEMTSESEVVNKEEKSLNAWSMLFLVIPYLAI